MLHDEEAVGDYIHHVCSKLRVLRLEFDGNDAGLVDLKRQQAIHVASQHALFGRLTHGVLDDPEPAEPGAERGRTAQHRIELRLLGELQFANDVKRQPARQDELNLTGHSFLIDGRAALARTFCV